MIEAGFTKLKPNMLIECCPEGISEYYLVTTVYDDVTCEAYKLNVNHSDLHTTVELAALINMHDLPSRVVAIYGISGGGALFPSAIGLITAHNDEWIKRTLVWRKPANPLEVTMEEVCEKFGQEVKIVKAHA